MLDFYNLFPRDTRCIELTSSTSMIALGISFFLDGYTIYLADQTIFFSMIFVVLGALNIFGIVLTEVTPSRVIINILSATFWVWISLMSHFTLQEFIFVTLAMGISNYYSFIINLLTVRKEWK